MNIKRYVYLYDNISSHNTNAIANLILYAAFVYTIAREFADGRSSEASCHVEAQIECFGNI